nr:unnamed protein product [Callosobruchus chinensis]
MFEGALFAGFARLPCGQNRTRFRHWYSPVTNFVNRLLKAYPNVRLKLGSEEFQADSLPTTTLSTVASEGETGSVPTKPPTWPSEYVSDVEKTQFTGNWMTEEYETTVSGPTARYM